MPPLLSCVTLDKCLSLSGPSVEWGSDITYLIKDIVRSAWAHHMKARPRVRPWMLAVVISGELLGWRPGGGQLYSSGYLNNPLGRARPTIIECQVEAQVGMWLAQSHTVSGSLDSWSVPGGGRPFSVLW